jgi:hypothetical protein
LYFVPSWPCPLPLLLSPLLLQLPPPLLLYKKNEGENLFSGFFFSDLLDRVFGRFSG